MPRRGYLREFEYENSIHICFSPPEMPKDIQLDSETQNKLIDAMWHLGRLRQFSESVENPERYYAPAILRKEAEMSGKMAETQSQMESFSRDSYEADEDTEGRSAADLIEATRYGLRKLKWKPMDTLLLKKIHEKAMNSEDVEAKGEFYDGPRWINSSTYGSERGIENAVYVAPKPTEVSDLMENLIEYINNPDADDLHILAKIALFHYQFEIIHPFEDGNGRVGRLLVMLSLCDENITDFEGPILNAPLINLSDFFLRNRSDYDDKLCNAVLRGEINEWIQFFLEGVIKQSEWALDRLNEIKNLKKEYKKRVEQSDCSSTCKEVVDILIEKPVLKVSDVQEELDISNSHANGLLTDLENLDIVERSQENDGSLRFTASEITDILYSNYEFEY